MPELPVLHPPTPSLCLCGRLWTLVPGPEDAATQCCWVEHDGQRLHLSGDFIRLGTLDAEWQASCRAIVANEAARLWRRPERRESAQALSARETLCRDRSLLIRDVLYLSETENSGPWLACILPAHWNNTLGRYVNQDFAVGEDLKHARQRCRSLLFFQKNSSAAWIPYSAPNGLCLGSGLSSPSGAFSGVLDFAYFRAVGVRIMENGGRFHERDG